MSSTKNLKKRNRKDGRVLIYYLSLILREQSSANEKHSRLTTEVIRHIFTKRGVIIARFRYQIFFFK